MVRSFAGIRHRFDAMASIEAAPRCYNLHTILYRRDADAARDKAVEEAAMSEDTKHAPQHPKFISLEDDCDIDYWAGKFAVSRDRLAAAVGRVGDSAEALERYLKRG
jgi:hypothetical protein